MFLLQCFGTNISKQSLMYCFFKKYQIFDKLKIRFPRLNTPFLENITLISVLCQQSALLLLVSTQHYQYSLSALSTLRISYQHLITNSSSLILYLTFPAAPILKIQHKGPCCYLTHSFQTKVRTKWVKMADPVELH